jgi:hypothetical protein
MKRAYWLILSLTLLACGKPSESNEQETKVEENSGENISPQLEDSVDRFKVDSISSAKEAQEEKANELEDGNSQ